jgi:hypothetical protein
MRSLLIDIWLPYNVSMPLNHTFRVACLLFQVVMVAFTVMMVAFSARAGTIIDTA